MKPLNNPRRVSKTADGVRVEYPGVPATGNPFEGWGRDSLIGLARRILIGEANPNVRSLFVTREEIERVIALNPGEPIPDIVTARLTKFGRGEIRSPRGRKSHADDPAFHYAHLLRSRAYYDRTFDRLRNSERLFNRARRLLRFPAHARTPANCAAELTRRRFFPQMATFESVSNLLSADDGLSRLARFGE